MSLDKKNQEHNKQQPDRTESETNPQQSPAINTNTSTPERQRAMAKLSSKKPLKTTEEKSSRNTNTYTRTKRTNQSHLQTKTAKRTTRQGGNTKLRANTLLQPDINGKPPPRPGPPKTEAPHLDRRIPNPRRNPREKHHHEQHRKTYNTPRSNWKLFIHTPLADPAPTRLHRRGGGTSG
ncbi:predicted protein [Arabidopsis lyrata subsp. lyrata]|uniref:Predicted protein n=1 Tax=Arabidopsis lyrata subsp. lyrata TaxID=81972 RepID=D7MPD1_ARALL|nr:predicted protein [Arabidopsis lyrata subsp. lyrata]